MDKVRTIIWDCDNVMWFHKEEEPQILAKALNINALEEFSEEFNSFFENFLIYFKNKKVNMKETLKLIENNMPILEVYGVSPEHFMKVVSSEKSLKTKDFNKDTLIVMEYLRNKGIKCIVKSDWFRSIQEELLKTYGILKYIEELHCCDNAYLKCCPASVQEIIKQGREEQYLLLVTLLQVILHLLSMRE